MPEKQTIERAREAEAEGKAPTTQASEFVREEMHHIRKGKHGARSTKQAIAIGLSKARRAGVELPPPEKGTTSEETRRGAVRALRKGRGRDTADSRAGVAWPTASPSRRGGASCLGPGRAAPEPSPREDPGCAEPGTG